LDIYQLTVTNSQDPMAIEESTTAAIIIISVITLHNVAYPWQHLQQTIVGVERIPLMFLYTTLSNQTPHRSPVSMIVCNIVVFVVISDVSTTYAAIHMTLPTHWARNEKSWI